MRTRVDLPLLLALLFLIGVGIVMVYSSSWVLATSEAHDSFYFLRRQVVFAALGAVALVIGVAVDPDVYRRHTYGLLVAAGLLLVVVLIPGVGASAGIARRWIDLGPFAIQAGEPTKFALVCYLAMSLAKKGSRVKRFAVGVAPHVIVPGVLITLLLAEPDFGTAVMLVVVTGLMMFVGGVPVRYLLGGVLLFLPVAVGLVTSSAYRMRRVLAFLDPWAHRYDIGYQVTESLMAFGSGGLGGLGIGDSRQKLFFLPAAHTDFIFAVVGEELGFVGVALVMGAFAIILARGISSTLAHRDPFRAFLSLGLTLLLVVQAATNMAVVLGVVPTKGLTLPFISYGGSSLIVSAFMGGVLLRLSSECRVSSSETGGLP